MSKSSNGRILSLSDLHHKSSVEKVNAPDYLKALIGKIVESERIKEYEAVYKSVSTAGANYMASLYLIDIKSENSELNLFAKISNSPSEIRGMIDAHAMYEREKFFYTTLANTFDSLETKYSVPVNEKLNITKYYGSDLTEFKEALILDNLTKKGYILYDRFKSIDWDYAKAALDNLAKFHALSYALKYHDPKKFDDLVKNKSNVMYIKNEESKAAFQSFYEKLLNSAIASVADNEEHVAAVKKFRKTLEKAWLEYFIPNNYSVLAHCDFRTSNIMVKMEGADIKSMIIIDYQNICYGSPLNDLIYFLITSTDQQFRDLNYGSYILHYYESLTRALEWFSLSIGEVYPKSIFYSHLQEKLPFGLTVAVTVLPFVVGIPGEVPKMESNSEGTSLESKLFNERFRGIIEDLIKWKVL